MLFNDTYKTIEAASTGQFKERGSKFIAKAYPVRDEKQIKPILNNLRKEYHDARHHCYAFRLGFDKLAYRVNDDGEPHGSAGMPIYGQLLSNDLTNILVVVIRYFGGTKLGIPGLINAYRTATKAALDNAAIITKTVRDVYEINFEYPEINDVMKILKKDEIEQTSTHYDLFCKITIAIRQNGSTKLYDKLKKMDGISIKYIKTI